MGMYFDAVAVLVEVILYLVLHDLIILISHEFAYFMNEGLYFLRYLNYSPIYNRNVILGYFCLDAKLKFDDNANYRQKAVFDQRDYAQEDPSEVEADKQNLNYIALDGDIG